MRTVTSNMLAAIMATGLSFGLAPAIAAAPKKTPTQPAECDPATAQCDDTAEEAALAAAAAASEAAMSEPADMTVAERAIDDPFGNAMLGAPDGDVTLVVFADYACPACRAAQPVIDQLIAQDPKLKVVYRLLVNEDEGREAALTSLAVAGTSADWGRFHHALDAGGTPTSRSIAKALVTSGIDKTSLPQVKDIDGDNSAIFQEISNNDALITERNGQAIPAWVIGDGEALNGFELATLQAAIVKSRSGGR
jgi:protein-disulfide isomerase